MYLRPHPCVTASPLSLEERALARVSKDGGRLRALRPSFETFAEFIIGPSFARTRWQAPQDEVGDFFTNSEEAATRPSRRMKPPHLTKPYSATAPSAVSSRNAAANSARV